MNIINYDQIKILARFILEREKVRQKKEAGCPKPWTEDLILQQYRFCNVNRERDTVTEFIRDQFIGYSERWFSLVVARLLNQPDSLKELDLEKLDVWREQEFINVLQNFQSQGGRVFNAAYIVSTAGAKGCKIEYYAKRVLTPIWGTYALQGFVVSQFTKLEDWYKWLTQFRSIGPFIANQIITDMRYENMRQAKDWTTFVMPGPGTMRGLNRIYDRPVEKSTPLKQCQEEILLLRELLSEESYYMEATFTDPNNLSNCLCEFDKYMRVYNNEGKTPKQKYPGRS